MANPAPFRKCPARPDARARHALRSAAGADASPEPEIPGNTPAEAPGIQPRRFR